jgi:hypothetical protein
MTEIFTSWPVPVCIALIVIAALFQRPIRAFIERTNKFKAGHLVEMEAGEVGAGQQKQVETAKLEAPTLSLPPSSPTQPVPPLPNPDPLYDLWDKWLREGLDRAFGDNADLKLAWAIRQSSINIVDRNHEMSYRLFFTSQILALKQLNLAAGSAPLSALRNMYDEAARQNPNFFTRLTWDLWISFLQTTGYVQVDEGDLDPIVRLTPAGKRFVVWMAERSVSEVKPF